MPRPLSVGVQLPEVEREVRWPEYVEIARAAEASGFDSIWVGDHLLYRGGGRPERGPWEVWTTMAALAQATERVRIGPLVACLGFHPPAVMAKMAATIDEISGGRFVFGVGSGWNETEFRGFGIPYDRRVSRFEEGFEVVRRLLDGETVSYEGRYVQVHDGVLLPRPHRRVPLMIGSNGPRMLSIALPHAQAWNTWFDGYGNSPAGFAELNATISEAAAAAGRAPGEIARSACVFVLADPGRSERPVTDENPPVAPEDLATHLRALADAGADEAILVVSPITAGAVRSLAPVLAALDR